MPRRTIPKASRVVALEDIQMKGCLFTICKGSLGTLMENRASGVSLVKWDNRSSLVVACPSSKVAPADGATT